MIKHMTERETLHFLRAFGAKGYGLLHLLGREFDRDGYFNDADLRLFADIWGEDCESVKKVAEFADFLAPGGPAIIDGGPDAPAPAEPRGESNSPDPADVVEAPAPAEPRGESNSPDPADVVEAPAPTEPQGESNSPDPADVVDATAPAPSGPAPAAAKRGRKPKAAAPPPAMDGRLPLEGVPLAAIEAELTTQIEQNDFLLFQKTGLKPDAAKKHVKEFILERKLSGKPDEGVGQLFLHFCYWFAKKPAPPAAVVAAENPRAAEQTPDGKPTTAAEYARQMQEAFDKMDELDRKYHPEDYAND